MNEITVARTITAPRETVYAAWTDPAELGWFFNPGFTSTHPIDVDPREGGTWTIEMIINDDYRYLTGGIYLELVPPERIVFAFGAVDGWPELDPRDLSDAPIVTITLTAATELTLHMTVPARYADMTEQMRAGWGETLDRLVASLQ